MVEGRGRHPSSSFVWQVSEFSAVLGEPVGALTVDGAAWTRPGNGEPHWLAYLDVLEAGAITARFYPVTAADWRLVYTLIGICAYARVPWAVDP